MNKFKNIQKGIMTTLLGLVILGVTVHRYMTTGEIDFMEVIGAIGGVGLLFSPDPKIK